MVVAPLKQVGRGLKQELYDVAEQGLCRPLNGYFGLMFHYMLYDVAEQGLCRPAQTIGARIETRLRPQLLYQI